MKFKEMQEKILDMLDDDLILSYPNFVDWYYSKIVDKDNNIVYSGREVLFVLDEYDQVVGSCIIRYNDSKICTFYIQEEYRGCGYGSLLIDESIRLLGSRKPIITCSMYNIYDLYPFLYKYGFNLTRYVEGLYKDSVVEYIFNDTQNLI